jgi:hypothetical protein
MPRDDQSGLHRFDLLRQPTVPEMFGLRRLALVDHPFRRAMSDDDIGSCGDRRCASPSK